jgi:hypothetical protein
MSSRGLQSMLFDNTDDESNILMDLQQDIDTNSQKNPIDLDEELQTDYFQSLFASEFDKYNDSPNIKIQYVNPYLPFTDMSNRDMDTLFFPDIFTFSLSNTYSLDDSSFSTILDSFLIGLSFQNLGHRVCHIYSDKIEDYFMQIDLNTFRINMSIDSINKIQNCISSNEKKIILIPIRLDFLNITKEYDPDSNIQNIDSLYGAHSNLLIIDTNWKTIEFFEPHGDKLGHTYSEIVSLEKIIENFIKLNFNLQSYAFINVSNTCPIGVQSRQNTINPESGHCLVWSLYFIMIRLMNINFVPKNYKTVSEIINETIHKMNINEPIFMDMVIREFLSYIETLTIYKNPRYSTHINVYDATQYIDNKTILELETRLRHLIRTYFLKANQYKINFKKVFREIISYKNLPNFENIFIEELSNNILF